MAASLALDQRDGSHLCCPANRLCSREEQKRVCHGQAELVQASVYSCSAFRFTSREHVDEGVLNLSELVFCRCAAGHCATRCLTCTWGTSRSAARPSASPANPSSASSRPAPTSTSRRACSWSATAMARMHVNCSGAIRLGHGREGTVQTRH